MSNFAELFLALPMARLPELARQLGQPVPANVSAGIAANDSLFGPDGSGYEPFGELCQVLSPRIAATIPAVPPPYHHVKDGSETLMIICNNEADPRLGDVFVGVKLHSTYTHAGIPEAMAAAVGWGYAITPVLTAAADALRQKLAGLAPIFAEALLLTNETHW